MTHLRAEITKTRSVFNLALSWTHQVEKQSSSITLSSWPGTLLLSFISSSTATHILNEIITYANLWLSQYCRWTLNDVLPKQLVHRAEKKFQALYWEKPENLLAVHHLILKIFRVNSMQTDYAQYITILSKTAFVSDHNCPFKPFSPG